MEQLFNAIIAWINSIDTQFFLAINSRHFDALDPVMWTLSSRPFLAAVYDIIALSLFYRRPWKQALVALIFMGIVLGATDYICASVIRPFFERMRPSNPANPISDYVHLINGYRSGKYGFPSCHAANTFALITFYCLYRRHIAVTVSLMTLGVIVCYSRIYLGVHYPGDIIAGFVAGSLIALAFFRLAARCRRVAFLSGWLERDKVIDLSFFYHRRAIN